VTDKKPFESEAAVSLVLDGPMTLSDLRQFLVFTTTLGMPGGAFVTVDSVGREALTVWAWMTHLGRED